MSRSSISRSAGSGYGRGTTTADVAARQTSLGFHEGRHGLDFIEFISQNPPPRFLGRRRMTVTQFQNAATAYENAVTQYSQRLDSFSEQRTDCVGYTIDQHRRANGFTSSICQQAAPPAAPAPAPAPAPATP